MKEVVKIISKLKNRGVQIKLQNGDLLLEGRTNSLDTDLLELLKENKDEIKHFLVASSNNLNGFDEIRPVEEKSNYPLSSAQRRLWVSSQFEGGSEAYNIPLRLELNGYYDIDSFSRSIKAVIVRHEILRTVFKEDDDGEIRQWILTKEELDFSMDYQDFREKENKEVLVRDYIKEDSYKVFDLEKGPLLRVALLHSGEDQYVFYLNMHHIISDVWSLEVLAKDIMAYYQAYKENKEPNLAKLRIQYKDYTVWQLGQLELESFKIHRDYWIDQFSGELPIFELPTTKQRPLSKTYAGHILGSYIGKTYSLKLKEYTQSNGGTLFMALLASLKALFHRYTGQEDFIIGSPVAGRDHVDLEDQIGFYINTLALRNQVKGAENFDELFTKVKESTLSAYSHQWYPFDRLVEELDIKRDASRSAIFDVAVTLQNISNNSNGFKVVEDDIDKIIDHGSGVSKFDINFVLQEVGNCISFIVTYNTDVYEKELIEQFIIHYKNMLHGILDCPNEQIGKINYLTEQEEHKLLHTFNDTQVEYPGDKNIVELFETQVKEDSEAIALVYEGSEMSYGELDSLSNQFAHYLGSRYTTGSDVLIGVKLDRSIEMLVSILGILKSGSAYVPIDPGYPQERIAYMLKDSGCEVLIDSDEYLGFKTECSSFSDLSLGVSIDSSDLCYVIYTSGSTGYPKGVMVEHGSVIRLVKNSNYVPLNTLTVLLSTGSVSFDATVFEYWGPLLNGGQLVLCSESTLLDGGLLQGLILDRGVNTMWFSSGLLNLYVDTKFGLFSDLSFVIAGGDKLSKFHIEKLYREYPDLVLFNGYGPTENTTFSTCHMISESDLSKSTIPIGIPISNSTAYILGASNGLQPVGVVGEICLGGAGLARGYLNKEELTSEKFIAHPFKEGERLYKTGDLGRWLSDGTIEFVGRKDDQVKIRGYRIELGEIENVIQRYLGVSSALYWPGSYRREIRNW